MKIKEYWKNIIKNDIRNAFIMTVMLISIILLFSYMWSKIYIENIPFGIVDNDNSAISRNIVSQFKNHSGLDVKYFADSEEELQTAIRERKINAGIIIPKNFSMDIRMQKYPKVLIIIDNSNILIGGNALSYSMSVLGTVNAGTQIKMMEGRGMYPSLTKTTVGTFTYVERTLYDPQGGYIRNLIYIIVPLVIQLLFITRFSLPMFIEKKKQFYSVKIFSKECRNIILDIIIRTFIQATIGIIGSLIALLLTKKIFSLPLRGDILIYVMIMYMFYFCLTSFSLVFASCINNVAYFIQGFLTFNLGFSFIAGVVYPLYKMPENLLTIINIFSPLTHFAVSLKILNLKGVGWGVLGNELRGAINYSITCFFIGCLLYMINIFINRNIHVNKIDFNLQDIQENDRRR